MSSEKAKRVSFYLLPSEYEKLKKIVEEGDLSRWLRKTVAKFLKEYSKEEDNRWWE